MLAMWNSPTLSRKRLWVAQHGDGFNKDAYDVSIAQVGHVNILGLLLCFSFVSCRNMQQIMPQHRRLPLVKSIYMYSTF